MTLYVSYKEFFLDSVKRENQLFTKNTAFSKHNSGCIRSESCPMKQSEMLEFTLVL